MKRIFYLILLILSFSQISIAQTKAEKEVAAAVENLRQAMISADKKQLEELADDRLTYGHSLGKIENKAQFVEALVSGQSDFVTIDLADQTVLVTGKTAIVRHTLSAAINDGGKPGKVKLGVMMVWQKQGGQWKLLGRQSCRL